MKCNNCGNEDHRSERCHLASDNFYERGFRAGIAAAAQVALDIECEEGAAFVCGDLSGVIKRSPYDAIRALATAE